MQRLARLSAAALLLVGGLVHLQLWKGGYRVIPYIGTLFLLNAAASAFIAVALVATASRWVTLPAIGLALGSLAALVMSRTVGLLGFMESAWTPASLRSIAAEVGAIVAIALVVVMNRLQRLALLPVSTKRR